MDSQQKSKSTTEEKAHIVVRISNGDTPIFTSLTGDSTIQQLTEKLGDSGKYILYDKRKQIIYDLESKIKDLALFDSKWNQYTIEAKIKEIPIKAKVNEIPKLNPRYRSQSNAGKQYIDLPESKLDSLHLSLTDRQYQIRDTTKHTNEIFGSIHSQNNNTQVEYLDVVERERLYKGNRRLLYGRIPAPDSINNAQQRMFDLKADVDWDDVLFTDLNRESKIVESQNIYQTALAESAYVNSDVKVKAVGYGAASAGFNHSSKFNNNEDSKYFAMTARTTITRAQILVNSSVVQYSNQFMNELNMLLNNGITYKSQWRRFLERYGYFYISQAQLGGAAFMTDIAMESKNQTDSERRQQLRGSLEADMLYASVSANISVGSGNASNNLNINKTSNRTLSCTGGEPHLCTFNTFSKWEESLIDYKSWGVTNALQIEPFYNLLDPQVKVKLFELVPSLREIQRIVLSKRNGYDSFDDSDEEEEEHDFTFFEFEEQISDFYGSHTMKYGYGSYRDKMKLSNWCNTQHNTIRAVEFIDNSLIHGFMLHFEQKIDDYKKKHNEKKQTDFGYISDLYKSENSTFQNDSIKINDLKMIKLQKTEVINRAKLWMDPAETYIIGLQLMTNLNREINVIPPGFMALQLVLNLATYYGNDNESKHFAKKISDAEHKLEELEQQKAAAEQEVIQNIVAFEQKDIDIIQKAIGHKKKSVDSNMGVGMVAAIGAAVVFGAATFNFAKNSSQNTTEIQEVATMYGINSPRITSSSVGMSHTIDSLQQRIDKLEQEIETWTKMHQNNIKQNSSVLNSLDERITMRMKLGMKQSQNYNDDMKQDIYVTKQSLKSNEKAETIFKMLFELAKHPNFDYNLAIALAENIKKEKHKWKNGAESIKKQCLDLLDKWTPDQVFENKLCEQYEVFGDKLIDMRVSVNGMFGYENIDGVQFKFVMYK
eukprot:330600_1